MERLREKEKQANSLGIRLHINATPDVTASIEIDKDAGNILSGNGNGVIDLDIRPSSGTFSINGNYIITSGTYHSSHWASPRGTSPYKTAARSDSTATLWTVT